MATQVMAPSHAGLSVRSPPGPPLDEASFTGREPWQDFVAARADEGVVADQLELSKQRAAIEAVVAENERLRSIIEMLRTRGSAPETDARGQGTPAVADFFYRPRAKARHVQAMGWSQATHATTDSSFTAQGSWYALANAQSMMTDETLVRRVEEELLNPGAPPAAYDRLDPSSKPGELKVPVKVTHVHTGGVREALREVLVPVKQEVAVEVPRLSDEQKAELLKTEVDDLCKKCDDPDCDCHTVPVREVIKEVPVETRRQTGEVPIVHEKLKVVEREVPCYQNQVQVVYVDRPILKEVVKVVPVEKEIIVEKVVVQEVEVIREVPVEVIREVEVVREVPGPERIVEVEVVREVPIAQQTVEREVIKEVEVVRRAP